MCGLIAIYGYAPEAPRPSLDELRRSRDSMVRRGPDAAGEWASSDGRVLLGHRRLSIIDLNEAANQPLIGLGGDVVIVFNGEIYNHAALRAELTSSWPFKTHSDTEVILAAYHANPRDFIGRLRGMYAFVIWDRRRGELLAARDPYGIKPLYVADNGHTIRFASQVRALLAGGQIRNDIDLEATYGYFCWGSVPEPRTMIASIKAVPPGHVLRVNREGSVLSAASPSVQSLFLELSAESAEDAASTIADALRDTVQHHLVADVPVGVFLSAGIDSTVLATQVAELSTIRPKAVTLGFREFQGTERDETILAAEVAKELGLDHHIYWLEADEFLADLDHAMAAMDQPSIDGINTYFVSKAAASIGLKTVLSGLGGDELFGGYPSFHDLPRWQRMRRLVPDVKGIPSLLGAGIKVLRKDARLRSRIPAKLAGILDAKAEVSDLYALRRGLFLPAEAQELTQRILGLTAFEAPSPMDLHPWNPLEESAADYRSIAALESTLYMRNQLLRDSDWASMAHSLELRVPLVDYTLTHRMVPLLTSLDSVHKGHLRGSRKYRFHEKIYARKKSGFHTPVDRWILSAGIMDPAESEGRPSRDWAKVTLNRYLRTVD